MKQVMPDKLLNKKFRPINLEKFFGFVYAQIIISSHLNISYACVRKNGELILLVGKGVDLYFSEELKAFLNWSYQVKPIISFEHEKYIHLKLMLNIFMLLKK